MVAGGEQCCAARRGSALGCAVATVVILALSGIAAATPATVDTVTFSDELGGLRIERVTGHGTLDDPFVVVEQLTSSDGGTLLLRIPPDFGNRIGSVHAIGLALVKVVENATDFAWTSFDLGLQSEPGVASDYLDGLSFGQGSIAGRPFTASGFGRVTVVDEPYDRISLTEGRIPIGGRMIVRFVISETMPLNETFLVQLPIRPIAELSATPPRERSPRLGGAHRAMAARSARPVSHRTVPGPEQAISPTRLRSRRDWTFASNRLRETPIPHSPFLKASGS